MSLLIAPNLLRQMMTRYKIQNAVLFDGSTGYFSWTPSGVGNSTTVTYSFWALIGAHTSVVTPAKFLTCGTGNSGYTDQLQIYADRLRAHGAITNGPEIRMITDALFRDQTAWSHFVFVFDSSNAIKADRIRIYVNGARNSIWNTEMLPALNFKLKFFNTQALHKIGEDSYDGLANFSGYLADFYAVDGQALAPTDFGEFDAITGNWSAKNYAGTYGANGFHLDFSNAADLGADVSGNANNWTVNGTVTQVTSTPTNVYAIPNPLDVHANLTLSNGNKTITNLTGFTGGVGGSMSFDIATSKLEWQLSIISERYLMLGIIPIEDTTNITSINPLNQHVYYGNTGQTYIGVGNTNYGAAFTTGDKIKIRINNGVVNFFKWVASAWVDQGVAWSGLTGQWRPWFNTAGIGVADIDFGQDGFTPSAGFITLNTDNLPEITAKDKNVDHHFKTILYTGDGVAIGAGGQSITGVGFQPDFVWIKNRTVATTSHCIFDNIRGALNNIRSDTSGAETTIAESLVRIDSDGFTSGSYSDTNGSGSRFVAWCANLPNTVTSGWAGSPSITPSKEIYNADLGMSIVTYTGNGTAGATIPHSIGKKPGMVIIKALSSAGGWMTYHSSLGATKYLYLHVTLAETTWIGAWNNTEPTANLITLGTGGDLNANGVTYVAYIFAESDFIKIGSYAGNGSADGPFINAGISPVWLLTKRTDIADDWNLVDDERDNYNPTTHNLHPNQSWAENVVTDRDRDLVANGIKIRKTGPEVNANGGTYLYMTIGQPNSSSETNGR
ncbi:MAG: hypothetical protein JKY92_09600 [Magnetovibrio sp.]|nr:hypothetical protein [Magnetovibrio sp.]